MTELGQPDMLRQQSGCTFFPIRAPSTLNVGFKSLSKSESREALLNLKLRALLLKSFKLYTDWFCNARPITEIRRRKLRIPSGKLSYGILLGFDRSSIAYAMWLRTSCRPALKNYSST